MTDIFGREAINTNLSFPLSIDNPRKCGYTDQEGGDFMEILELDRGITLAWCALEGESGHDAGLRLLAALYRRETGNGMPVDGRKVKGTIHWVSAPTAIDATCCLYDNLFTLENTGDVPEGTNYLDYLNPESLKKLEGCKLEPSVADVPAGTRMQFVRMGYFIKDEEPGRFNRIVTLKDSFAKTLQK